MLTIEHDRAHRLADIACDAKNYSLAIKLLKHAKSNLGVGLHSSLRTCNRLLNLHQLAKEYYLDLRQA